MSETLIWRRKRKAHIGALVISLVAAVLAGFLGWAVFDRTADMFVCAFIGFVFNLDVCLRGTS